MPQTPQNVLDALSLLDAAELAVVKDYIAKLEGIIDDFQGKVSVDDDADEPMDDSPDMPPLYESGEDYDTQSNLKMEATDLVSEGKLAEALEKYTGAVLAAPASALLYANRATVLLKLQQYAAAVRDCDEALNQNPDSAKALRVRGKARKALGQWEAALQDLSQAQQIDFDEGTVDDLKECSEKHVEAEKARASSKVEEEEKKRKRAEEIRKAREEQANEARAAAREMPSGMPGGMGGMGGMPSGMGGMPPGFMESILSDPDLAASMQNPKVVAAFSELMSGPGGPMGLMSNPAKLQELMADPDVGPVLQKLMSKFGGMGAGMPGGMGGATADVDDLDDLPDMDDIAGAE
jgi:suppressor of tumorigenicity protein 13